MTVSQDTCVDKLWFVISTHKSCTDSWLGDSISGDSVLELVNMHPSLVHVDYRCMIHGRRYDDALDGRDAT